MYMIGNMYPSLVPWISSGNVEFVEMKIFLFGNLSILSPASISTTLTSLLYFYISYPTTQNQTYDTRYLSTVTLLRT